MTETSPHARDKIKAELFEEGSLFPLLHSGYLGLIRLNTYEFAATLEKRSRTPEINRMAFIYWKSLAYCPIETHVTSAVVLMQQSATRSQHLV